MNGRLFKDNGCETLTDEGESWSELTSSYLRALVDKALQEGISLRDLTTVVIDEITVLTAENRIRKGIKERADQRR